MSELIQIDEFLKTEEEVHRRDESPRPCEHFDLICGTSVGGLLAILFGPLGMSCEEVREFYERLGRMIYVKADERTGALILSSPESNRIVLREQLELLVNERAVSASLENDAHDRCYVRAFSFNLLSLIRLSNIQRADLCHHRRSWSYSHNSTLSTSYLQGSSRRDICRSEISYLDDRRSSACDNRMSSLFRRILNRIWA